MIAEGKKKKNHLSVLLAHGSAKGRQSQCQFPEHMDRLQFHAVGKRYRFCIIPSTKGVSPLC